MPACRGCWRRAPPCLGLHVPAGGGARDRAGGYPGLLARELIGRRSYKSDDAAAQTRGAAGARGPTCWPRSKQAPRGWACASRSAMRERERLLADAKGDCIDAALCLVQAAWGAARRSSAGPGYGLPADIDPLEGWIVTA